MTKNELERLLSLLGKLSEDTRNDGRTNDAIGLVRHVVWERLET